MENDEEHFELPQEQDKNIVEDLKKLENRLNEKFLNENNFAFNQMDIAGAKSISSKKEGSKRSFQLQNAPKMTKMQKIDKIIRKHDEEYYKQIKDTDNCARSTNKLLDELAMYQQKVKDIKQVNRDEELLRMQKENQEIESQLNLLKKRDVTELNEKKEVCKQLVEDLNVLFNEKKNEASEKEKERQLAIEQIKSIKKEQEVYKADIQKLDIQKGKLTAQLEKLEKDVESYKIYKTFIDQVNAKYSSDTNSNQNDMYDNLKEKFEHLMDMEKEIKTNIEECEKEKEAIKKEISELKRKNEKQSQNTKLQELEAEIKNYSDMNKQLEIEIDTILKEKQKKDSDIHQIKLSINNLYMKATESKDSFELDEDESKLCMKLDKINDRIIDLIKIHKALEKI